LTASRPACINPLSLRVAQLLALDCRRAGAQFRGLLDEVRISDAALDPSQFLIAQVEGLPAPAPAPGAFRTVSAASFSSNGPVAPLSIVSGFGDRLSTSTEVAARLPLPTSLAGVTVRLRDQAAMERLAPLFFVSPTQINYLIPEGTTPGLAAVTVQFAGREVARGPLQVERVAPGLFSANASGSGPAAAIALRIKSDGSRSSQPVFQCARPGSCSTALIDLGPPGDQVYLLLFGTGVRGYSSNVSVSIGGQAVPLLGVGPQGEFLGLDQINIGPLPRGSWRSGDLPIALQADGRPANSVLVSITTPETGAGCGEVGSCVNISGSWRAQESGTERCTFTALGETETETETLSGSGTFDVQETGSCRFASRVVLGSASGNVSLQTEWTVTGTQVTTTGPAAVAVPGADVGFTENFIRTQGTVCGDRMTLSGAGRLAFTQTGTGGVQVSVSCDLTVSGEYTKIR
jgi:uncharacterized protein (TIGR03437 family)